MSLFRRHAAGNLGGALGGGGDDRLARTMSQISGNTADTENQFKALSPAAQWWMGAKEKISLFVNTVRGAVLGRGFQVAGHAPAQ